MLHRKKRHRHFVAWLGFGMLLGAWAGCQWTETPVPRANVKRNQASAISSDNLLGQQREKTNAGVENDGDTAGSGSKVSIDNFTFHPETLEIPAGTKVVWVNNDDVPHTVRSTEDIFRSGALDTDDLYECVFSEPGTYEYYCGVHRHMAGKIVVR
ncbi:MAG TPA: cupredoxin family copper-binding protein [Planctomycetaceae bacterium]|nr:cupredoxin family copper-binding protein [Planctomycetaceae bacterium]